MNGRLIENGLAVLGGLMAAAYVGLVEILPHACHAVGRCAADPGGEHGIPWGVVIVVAALVLPKTAGRMTAGRIYEMLFSRLPFKTSSRRRDSDDD